MTPKQQDIRMETTPTIRQVCPICFDSGSGRDIKITPMITPARGIKNDNKYRMIFKQPLYWDP